MSAFYLLLRYAHISTGLLGLVSGAAAMTFRKGSPLHRKSGTVFFVSMLIVAGSGALMAVFVKPNMGNLMGGITAFYLVATAWATVIREPGRTGNFEIAAVLVGLGIAATGITFGLRAANGTKGMLHGYPAMVYFIFAAVALLGSVLDARMIARGGLTGAARTTRHLWRMCLALFMATASLFLGLERLFPAAARESGLLPIPGFLPLGLLLYWLIRVRVWPLVRKARIAGGVVVPERT